MLQDTLIQRIQRFAALARDHRQVHRRLEQLLPDRLRELIDQQRRQGMSPSDAARAAFVSEDYLSHVEELTTVAATSWESRIQYETHMMLFEARRSLRGLKMKSSDSRRRENGR